MKFNWTLVPFLLMSYDLSAKRVGHIDGRNWGYLKIGFPAGVHGEVGLGSSPDHVREKFKDSTGPIRLDPNEAHFLRIASFYKAVGVRPNETTSFYLSGLSFVNPHQNRYAVDLGPRAIFEWEYQGQRELLQADQVISSPAPFLALPGRYAVRWHRLLSGLLEPISDAEVAPGQTGRRISLDQPEKRFTLRLRAPPSTLKNNSCFAKHTSEESPILIWRTSEPPKDDTTRVSPTPEEVRDKKLSESQARGISDFVVPKLHESLHFFPQRDSSYELIVSNQRIGIETLPDQSVDIEFGRVEVSDIPVRRKDGTSYYVSGGFTIFKQTDKGIEELSFLIPNCISDPLTRSLPQSNVTFQTNSGVNLPFGRYLVRLKYFLDGRSNTQFFHVNLDAQNPLIKISAGPTVRN